jgi:hypothetical protein
MRIPAEAECSSTSGRPSPIQTPSAAYGRGVGSCRAHARHTAQNGHVGSRPLSTRGCRRRSVVRVSERVESQSQTRFFRNMEKRRPPVTCCAKCGKVGYKIGFANGRCGETINGKPCRGIIQSALGVSDWAECPSCGGTGWTGEKCTKCDGAGWQFVRDRQL